MDEKAPRAQWVPIKGTAEEEINRLQGHLCEKFQAMVLGASQSTPSRDIATVANEFNRSIDGKLLYVRVFRREQSDSGVGTSPKTIVLFEKFFGDWRVTLPESSPTTSTAPAVAAQSRGDGAFQVARRVQDGRSYFWITLGPSKDIPDADGLEVAMAIDTRKPGEWPEGPAAVRQVIALLESPWQAKLSEEQLKEAAASLEPMADVALEEIMRRFGRATPAYRHRAVQVLERLQTERAKDALLEIALGRTAESWPSSGPWASAAFLRRVKDKAEVRKLLVSDDAGVLGNALRELRGVEVDEALLKRLLELSLFEGDKEPMVQENIRCLAAAVMAADPSGKFADQKVDAILTAVAKVASLPHAGKTHWPGSYTYAESSYSRYLQCLSEMPGADDTLRQARELATSPARDLLMIARAQRGDAAVRQDLYRVLDDPRAEMRRAWAVQALATIATGEDLALLKKLAESDPMKRDRGGCVAPPGMDNTYYPVREAAQRAIQQIEARPE